MKDNIDLIKRLNKTIVHDDGTFDSFEKQLLNLSGGIFDVTKPLIVSPDSSSISYFEESIDKPITMRVNTALKIREKHEIGYAFVGQCLDLLRSSVLAFESLTQENSMVVLLDDFNVDNDPYIAICRMDRLMNAVEVNEITSVYDKQNFEKFLVRSYDAGKHFYKNKKTEQYIRSQRLQLPKEMIFALSDAYYKPSFTKSQVEADIKSNNISSVKPALSSQIQSASSRTDDSRSSPDAPVKIPESER